MGGKRGNRSGRPRGARRPPGTDRTGVSMRHDRGRASAQRESPATIAVASRPAASDGHLQLGYPADVRGHRALGAHPAGGEHPERPAARGGEEPEAAVVAERHLSDEVTAGVQQTGVAGGHGGPAARRAASVLAHLPSPTSIGTPTSEPYSVHDPS